MVQHSLTIVADSTISLPPELISDLPLLVVPLEIHHNDKVYYDGVDLNPKQFYQMIREQDSLPTTSAPQPGSFLSAFQSASETSGTVICLTISSKLSASYESALAGKDIAKSLLPKTNIIVIDSQTAGTSEGLIALEAARAAKSGLEPIKVEAMIKRAIKRVLLVGYLDTLYYVWKGGRVPRVQMWMGQILGVKPILELSAGHIGMIERTRSRDRAQKRLVELAKAHIDGKKCRIAVVHADEETQAQLLADAVQEQINPAEMFLTQFTPVIGAHTGPGLVGIALHPTD